MTVGVYLITCRANNRRYIGSSKDIPARWKDHIKYLRGKRHDNPRMQNSWNKYGQECFEFAVLEVVDDEAKLREREQYWMNLIHPEFNISPYAERPTTEGLVRTSVWRQRSSEGNKKYWELITDEEREIRGQKATHPHTEETKRVLSEKTRLAFAEGRLPRKTRPRTDEEKAKIRASLSWWIEEKAAIRAQKRAEWEKGRADREAERVRKISLAHKGKVLSEETKEKLSIAATIQMSDPEMQERHRRATTEAMQRPEVKEAMKHRRRGEYTEERRNQISETHTGRKRPPETVEKMKEARRQWWARKKAEQQAETE